MGKNRKCSNAITNESRRRNNKKRNINQMTKKKTTKNKPTKNNRKGKIGKRLTTQQKAELKDTIMRLHVLSGVSLREIERQTGYDHTTVLRAWHEMKPELVKDLEEQFGSSEVVARSLMRKEQRVQQLTRIALSADGVSDRIRALQTANNIDDGIVNILQDTGVIKRDLGELSQRRVTKFIHIDESEYDALNDT